MGGREDSDETGSSGDPIERERVSFLGLVSLAEGDTYQPKSAHDLVIGLLRSFGGLGELVAPAAPTGLFPGIPTLESARDIGDPRGGYGNLSKEEMEREETGRFRRDLGPATWQSAY